MTYLENKNVDNSIPQKLRNKDLYETDMHNIQNIIVRETNKQLQYKAASSATFQAVKIGRYLVRYLVIIKKLCFANQSEQHPIRSLCLANSQLYKTVQHSNEKTTNYLVRFRNA